MERIAAAFQHVSGSIIGSANGVVGSGSNRLSLFDAAVEACDARAAAGGGGSLGEKINLTPSPKPSPALPSALPLLQLEATAGTASSASVAEDLVAAARTAVMIKKKAGGENDKNNDKNSNSTSKLPKPLLSSSSSSSSLSSHSKEMKKRNPRSSASNDDCSSERSFRNHTTTPGPPTSPPEDWNTDPSIYVTSDGLLLPGPPSSSHLKSRCNSSNSITSSNGDILLRGTTEIASRTPLHDGMREMMNTTLGEERNNSKEFNTEMTAATLAAANRTNNTAETAATTIAATKGEENNMSETQMLTAALGYNTLRVGCDLYGEGSDEIANGFSIRGIPSSAEEGGTSLALRNTVAVQEKLYEALEEWKSVQSRAVAPLQSGVLAKLEKALKKGEKKITLSVTSSSSSSSPSLVENKERVSNNGSCPLNMSGTTFREALLALESYVNCAYENDTLALSVLANVTLPRLSEGVKLAKKRAADREAAMKTASSAVASCDKKLEASKKLLRRKKEEAHAAAMNAYQWHQNHENVGTLPPPIDHMDILLNDGGASEATGTC